MTFGAKKRGPRSLRQLGGRGVLRGVRREYRAASRRAARTRGFAAPAFAGCAIVGEACPAYASVQEASMEAKDFLPTSENQRILSREGSGFDPRRSHLRP